MRRFSCFFVCLLAVAASTVAADTRSVYGPDVPGNTALVRVVNAAPGAAALSVELGGTRFDPLDYAEASPYRPITPDVYQFEAGGAETEIIPKAGQYYSVVCAPGAITVLEDPAHVDPARAQLFLYNFSSLPSVDLKTANGKTGVILGVQRNRSGMKIVNAVSVPLAVFEAARRVGEVGRLALERGSSFSVFVLGSGPSPKVVVVKARVAAE